MEWGTAIRCIPLSKNFISTGGRNGFTDRIQEYCQLRFRSLWVSIAPDIFYILQGIPALVDKVIVNFKWQNGIWEDKVDQVHDLIHIGIMIRESDNHIYHSHR